MRYLLWVSVGLLSLLGFFFWFGLNKQESIEQNRSQQFVSFPFPEFSSLTLIDQQKVSTEHLKGSGYMVNIWASWCPSCWVEHPFFMKLAKSGVRILGINYRDNREDALSMLEEGGNPFIYSIVDRQGRLAISLGVTGAPETYFVNRDGEVVFRFIGVIDEAIWQTKLAGIYNSL